MMDFAKKGLYLGLGLASMTKEKVEEFAQEFAKRAQMNEEEGKKLAEYLKTESKKAQAELKDTVDFLVEKAMKQLPCEKKLARLEKRIAELEAKLGTAPQGAADACDDEEPCGCDKGS